jgi:ribonuclease BN (tRNA processing enzyme)
MAGIKLLPDSFVFLGTWGARVMVANQILASGGIWFNLSETQLLIDPGPGSIVQATKRNLKAEKLSAIFLTHRHLDHSADINIMVEAMTQGGIKPKGQLFAPSDALDDEPLLYSYLRKYLDKINILQEKHTYTIEKIQITTSTRNIHPVETYGLVIKNDTNLLGYLVDTRYSQHVVDSYQGCNLLIINVVLSENKHNIDHLTMADAENIITQIKLKVAILTHFGMNVWRAQPWLLAQEMSMRTGNHVIAAHDGMQFSLSYLDDV